MASLVGLQHCPLSEERHTMDSSSHSGGEKVLLTFPRECSAADTRPIVMSLLRTNVKKGVYAFLHESAAEQRKAMEDRFIEFRTEAVRWGLRWPSSFVIRISTWTDFFRSSQSYAPVYLRFFFETLRSMSDEELKENFYAFAGMFLSFLETNRGEFLNLRNDDNNGQQPEWSLYLDSFLCHLKEKNAVVGLFQLIWLAAMCRKALHEDIVENKSDLLGTMLRLRGGKDERRLNRKYLGNNIPTALVAEDCESFRTFLVKLGLTNHLGEIF